VEVGEEKGLCLPTEEVRVEVRVEVGEEVGVKVGEDVGEEEHTVGSGEHTIMGRRGQHPCRLTP
jgi:hypothetical protein